MKFDDLYRHFDGVIPHDDIRATEFKTHDHYMRAFARVAENNFYRRCLELVRSIGAWRMTRHYPDAVQKTMLMKLNFALDQSRASAVASMDLSNVAATAAPASTA